MAERVGLNSRLFGRRRALVAVVMSLVFNAVFWFGEIPRLALYKSAFKSA